MSLWSVPLELWRNGESFCGSFCSPRWFQQYWSQQNIETWGKLDLIGANHVSYIFLCLVWVQWSLHGNFSNQPTFPISHGIHVWYIFLHVVIFLVNVGKYTIYGAYRIWDWIPFKIIISWAVVVQLSGWKSSTIYWMVTIDLVYNRVDFPSRSAHKWSDINGSPDKWPKINGFPWGIPINGVISPHL